MDKRSAAVVAAAAALGISVSVILSSRYPHLSVSAGASNKATKAAVVMPPAETFDPVFEPCAHCHQVGGGARHSSGPALNGIIGRPAASTNYPYSQAMRNSGLQWDEVTLARFLMNPDTVVPGTRMLFKGMPEQEALHVIQYLRSVDERMSTTSVVRKQAP